MVTKNKKNMGFFSEIISATVKTAWKVYAVLKHIDSPSVFTISAAAEINEKANKIFGGI